MDRKRELETAPYCHIRQIYIDVDSNSIGDAGCHMLSKSNWPNLHTLDLCLFYSI
jgi:hypothetical protein